MKGSLVQFSGYRGVSLRGYFVPADPGTECPALVLAHEWWGLDDSMKDIANRFAAQGYAVLAPDLYSRLGNAVTVDLTEAAALMEQLPSQDALYDLNASIAFLRQQRGVQPWGIGCVGFGMGGTFALMLAQHNSDAKATVVFYGKVPMMDQVDKLLSPVQFHHGAKDDWVTVKEVAMLKQGLEKYGKPGEVHVYADAGHAFFDEARKEAYDDAAAGLAWERTLRFLEKFLRG